MDLFKVVEEAQNAEDSSDETTAKRSLCFSLNGEVLKSACWSEEEDGSEEADLESKGTRTMICFRAILFFWI